MSALQEIDGLREAELAGKQIGTTKRGIGPAYASKATRNGVRVGELRDLDSFANKLRILAQDGQKRFEGFQYDVEVRPAPSSYFWLEEMPLLPEMDATFVQHVRDLLMYAKSCLHA